MSTLKNKLNAFKRASDPLDRMIFEDGLRIKDVYINKESDMIIVLLNNRKIISRPLSDFKLLVKASVKQLNNFENDGISIYWKELDEDLGLRGFLKYELKQITRPAFV